MDNKIKNKKNEILKKMNMPRQVATGEPKIIIIGKEEVKIENHKGIKIFDNEKIILNTSIGGLTIKGNDFELLYIEEETIIVSGKFMSIYYGEIYDEKE
ncbi:MAG: YabP/YqfC family sporulation protein [Clostridium sp.]|uniref:YabP/YqfC family sporulation protein n=1 Tax=Clostridium sp. TaxID=1506 RepID=UPI003EE7C121